MTLYGYDAAYPPDPKHIADSGGLLMAVYLTGNYAVSALHCFQVHAAGMGVLLNYEEAANELVGCGTVGGREVGVRAMAAAIRDGAPADNTLGIFYSVDVGIEPARFAAVGEAFDGINAATRGKFKTHVYGEGALIDYLVSTGRCVGRQWLSGSKSFPGYNAQSANVGLVQLVGSNIPSTDQNIITNAAGLHAWWPAGSTLGGNDMALDASDKAWLISAVHDVMVSIATDPTHIYWAQLDRKLNALPGAAADQVWTQPLVQGGVQLTAAQAVARQPAQVDVTMLAAAVAAQIPGADTAAISAAVTEAVNALKLTISRG